MNSAFLLVEVQNLRVEQQHTNALLEALLISKGLPIPQRLGRAKGWRRQRK